MDVRAEGEEVVSYIDQKLGGGRQEEADSRV